MQQPKSQIGRLVQAGLIAGLLSNCGGSPAPEAAAPAEPSPAEGKHQCKAGHGCGGEKMDMHEDAGGGATPHVPE
ncbi:MAG: hypothetical protein IPI67_24060 [Myxococcales bacterium]|nr:hypothetical protein [Myxococcales bacterium]